MDNQRECVLLSGRPLWAIRVTSVRRRWEDRSSISSHPLADLGAGSGTMSSFSADQCSSFVCAVTVPSSRPAHLAGRRAQGQSRLAALRGHPQGLALTGPSTVPRSSRSGRRRTCPHAFEVALLLPQQDRAPPVEAEDVERVLTDVDAHRGNGQKDRQESERERLAAVNGGACLSLAFISGSTAASSGPVAAAASSGRAAGGSGRAGAYRLPGSRSWHSRSGSGSATAASSG
jgi:hypothetical protein